MLPCLRFHNAGDLISLLGTKGDYLKHIRTDDSDENTHTLRIGGALQRVDIFSTGNQRLLIDQDGKVGIGVADPDSMLEVVGGAGAQSINAHGVVKFRTTSNDSSELRHQFNMGGASDPGSYSIYQGNASTIGVNLAAGDVSDFNGGNVGIGETTPQNKLEVATSNGTYSHFGAIATTDRHYTGISLGYREDNLSYRKTAIVQVQIGDGAARGHLHFLVDTAANDNSVALVDSKMMIHGTSGNVGIGTASPSDTLHIAGGITMEAANAIFAMNVTNTTGACQIRFGDTGDADIGKIVYGHNTNAMSFNTADVEAFRLDANQNAIFAGNISGSSPSTGSFAKLAIGGSTPHDYYQLTIKDGSTAGLVLHDTGQSPYQIAANGSALHIRYNLDNAKSIFLKNDGNVGIGQSSPSAKLEIKGSGATTGITFKTIESNNNTTFWVQDGGAVGVHYWPFVINHDHDDSRASNTLFHAKGTTGVGLFVKDVGLVGIGTTSPTTTLHVKTDTGITIKTAGTTNTPGRLNLWSADTSIAANDTIAAIYALGTDSTSTAKTGSKIEFNADAVWDAGTANYQATRIDFFAQNNSGTNTLTAPVLQVAHNKISGSATSTGSFGQVETSRIDATDATFTNEIRLEDGLQAPAVGDDIHLGDGLSTTPKIRLGTSSWENNYGLESYYSVFSTNRNEGFIFKDSAGVQLFRMYGSTNGTTALRRQAHFFDDVIISGANAKISGSATSTGSFGKITAADKFELFQTGGASWTIEGDGENLDITRTSGHPRFVSITNYGSGTARLGINTADPNVALEVIGDISGSVTSTGSFGELIIDSNGTFGGTISSNVISITTGGGAVGADFNGTTVGRGQLHLNRDDTATVKQIQFHKNGSEHSYLETSTDGLKIGGANVTFTANATATNLIATTAVYSGGIVYGSTTLDLKDNGGNIFVVWDANKNATFKGDVISTKTNGQISGSATSTGSFGQLKVEGISISNNDGGVNNTIFGYKAGSNFSANNGSNIIMGPNAADAMDGTESHNIVIGLHAMGAADEGASGGIDFNIAIGNSSLGGGSFSGGTQLYGNIAIGYQALTSTGTNGQTGIVAIGFQALEKVTTGPGNLAIGGNAGKLLTTGQYNLAIGQNALTTATELDDNLAIGNGALRYASGSAGTGRNMAIGYLAGGAITSGEFNVMIGRSANGQATTAGSNTVMGYFAGYNTRSGSSNVMIGTQAGYAYQNGVGSNTYVGAFSGYQNRTGYGNTYLGAFAGRGVAANSHTANTGVGYNALNDITTGGSNSTLGFGSGDQLTTGHNNVAIGIGAIGVSTNVGYAVALGDTALGAGNATDAADGTVAIGSSALRVLTSGAGNTAVGFESLKSENDGSRNTAIGYKALTALNTSAGNGQTTAVGFEAGMDASTGINNTFVGSRAGNQGTNDITTGDNNTLIGMEARASAAAAANQTVIGASAIGVANNSVTLGNGDTTAVYMAQDSGATVHAAQLIVSGSANATDTIKIYGDASGNVGHAGITFDLDNSTDDAEAYLRLDRTAGTAFLGLTMQANARDGMRFMTDTTERLKILHNGNVGIGTSDINWTGLGIDHTVLSVGNPSAGMGMLELSGKRTSTAELGRLVWGNNTTRVAEIVAKRTDANNSADLLFKTMNAGSIGTRLTIADDGNIGIGTTSPDTKLDIVGDDFAGASLKIERTGDGENDDSALRLNRSGTVDANDRIGGIYFQDNDTSLALIRGEKIGANDGRLDFVVPNGSAVGNTTAPVMTIQNDKVGIGITTPGMPFQVSGSNNVASFGQIAPGEGVIIGNSGGVGYLIGADIGFSNYNPLGFRTSTNYALYIDTSDRVGIGTTSPTVKLQVAGTISGSLINSSGDVVAFNASDERLKDNIKLIKEPIKKIKQLRGVEYQWNGLQDTYPSGSFDSGIIAQDVQKVLPQLVKERGDGYLGVRQERLVGLLVESIKDQQKQIDDLRKQIKEMKNGSS